MNITQISKKYKIKLFELKKTMVDLDIGYMENSRFIPHQKHIDNKNIIKKIYEQPIYDKDFSYQYNKDFISEKFKDFEINKNDDFFIFNYKKLRNQLTL